MSETTIERAYSVGIRVRILQPTNTAGARFRVWRSDENYGGDPDRVTVGYNHALDSADNAAAAVKYYLSRKDPEHSDSWQGRWVLADAGGRNWLAVRVPS